MANESTGAEPRIKIAVCGEVKSGKTSLINALYRGDPLPDFSGTQKKPIIRLVFGGDDTEISIYSGDEAATTVSSFADVPTDGSISEVVINTPKIEELGECELIEFPPLRDGHVSQSDVDRVSACDILIWMTIGSQAWRLSEKTIVNKFTNRSPDLSLIVVSRVDKFRSDKDRGRLITRLKEETASYFSKGALLHADPDTVALAQEDDDAWDQTGGQAIAVILSELIDKARETRAAKEAQVASESEEPAATATSDKLIQRPRSSASRRRIRIASNAAEEPRKKEVKQPPQPQPDIPVPDIKDMEGTLPASAPELPTVKVTAHEVTPLDEIKGIAEKLDGLISLASFDLEAPESVTLFVGELQQAKECAVQMAETAKFISESPVLEKPETIHLSTENHQFIYQMQEDGKNVLLLTCRSSNPGMTRNTFLRIAKINDEMIAVHA